MNKKNICNCIDEILGAMAAAEALEHDAHETESLKMVGMKIDKILEWLPETLGYGGIRSRFYPYIPKKREIIERFDDLYDEYPQLEISKGEGCAITEPIAELCLTKFLWDIQEKCGVSTERARELASEGIKEYKKDNPIFGKAQPKFVAVKEEILRIAHELCMIEDEKKEKTIYHPALAK
jgi:hypothetical protein